MRFLSLIFAAALSTSSHACKSGSLSGFTPPIEYPSLPKLITSWQDIAPDDWDLREATYGDLNKDGRPDLLVSLEEFRALGTQETCDTTKVFDPNPTMIAVYLKNQNGKYDLAAQDHQLIRPRFRGSPGAQPKLTITNGIAIIRMRSDHSSFNNIDLGLSVYNTLRLRLDNACMRLIGLEHDIISQYQNNPERPIHKTNVSINTLTGIFTIKRTPDSSTPLRKGTLKQNPLFCLGNFTLDNGLPYNLDNGKYSHLDFGADKPLW